MRLCRFGTEDRPAVGFHDEHGIVPLRAAASAFAADTGRSLDLPDSSDLLDFLPPDGPGHAAARQLSSWLEQSRDRLSSTDILPPDKAGLLVPIPRPNKIFLLAGNYADHIREGGGVASERAETFPYLFMKPPSTTLTAPGRPIRLPSVSPAAVDWELELAVVIGRRVKYATEADALSAVAGYTVINDISHRRYRPNPARKERDRDKFFDWMHGKWFDGFCPCGPCVVSSDEITDPQSLRLTLTLNGETRQNASTAQMIFPVAALIAFVTQMVTLEPGDLISTGTPAGVGSSTGTFLKPGDVLRGTIERIGPLVTPVVSE
jgi:2-keto-4-pentenoate hydratase/2-oxohepta-3-ene-1,7-dioic acid hydratase in catechol pathway